MKLWKETRINGWKRWGGSRGGTLKNKFNRVEVCDLDLTRHSSRKFRSLIHFRSFLSSWKIRVNLSFSHNLSPPTSPNRRRALIYLLSLNSLSFMRCKYKLTFSRTRSINKRAMSGWSMGGWAFWTGELHNMNQSTPGAVFMLSYSGKKEKHIASTQGSFISQNSTLYVYLQSLPR